MKITIDISVTEYANKTYQALEQLTGKTAEQILTIRMIPSVHNEVNQLSYPAKRKHNTGDNRIGEAYESTPYTLDEALQIDVYIENLMRYRHAYEMLLTKTNGKYAAPLIHIKRSLKTVERLVRHKESKYRDAMIATGMITEEGLRKALDVKMKPTQCNQAGFQISGTVPMLFIFYTVRYNHSCARYVTLTADNH